MSIIFELEIFVIKVQAHSKNNQLSLALYGSIDFFFKYSKDANFQAIFPFFFAKVLFYFFL